MTEDKMKNEQLVEGIEKIIPFNLYSGEEPTEGKEYQFLGCHILKWGKTDKPTMAFTELNKKDLAQSIASNLILDEGKIETIIDIWIHENHLGNYDKIPKM